MNERRSDFDLLQRFARQGEQAAFADVVRRHLDLVFATALRKLEDPGAAQEVAQNVFSALARKAWQFAPDDSLPAWLHKAALVEAKSWLRGELRRRRREETAAELGTTMNTTEAEPAFAALVPLLDEALLSLREKDRTALLLRFYESQSLRDVGTSLGVGEDAAQKRVQSALEKLAEFFKRRGFKTATVAVATAALEHTATTASATVVSAVVSAVSQAAPPALAGFKALLARMAGLTKAQKTIVGVVVAAAFLFWLWRDQRPFAQRLQPQPIAAQPSAGSNSVVGLQTKVAVLPVESPRPVQSNSPPSGVAVGVAVDTYLPPTRRLLPAAWKASWAPDSKRLVFTRYGGGLSVLELESGQVTDLRPDGKDPAWSPDGKFIAYGSGTGLIAERSIPQVVWVVPAQGGEPVKIGEGGFPGWTLDSKHVLFGISGIAPKVFSVALDAPQEKPTVFFDSPTVMYPAISPDGTRIAASADRVLNVFDTNTKQPISRLAHGERGLLLGWSPDSRHVALGGFNRSPGLWIFDVERGGAYLVATNGTMPAWSPDGKRLVFDVREEAGDFTPQSTRELWMIETSSLPRNPVLTNQIPRSESTVQSVSPVIK